MVLIENNRLVLTPRADESDIWRNVLTLSWSPSLSRLIERPFRSISHTDGSLILKSVKQDLFYEFAIALADFVSQVDFRSLKYVHFK